MPVDPDHHIELGRVRRSRALPAHAPTTRPFSQRPSHAPGLEIVDRTVLFGGRPLSLPFRCRPLFLCGEAPTVRTPCGFGRPTGSSFGSQTLCHEVGELGQCDLAIAQLRAPLGGGNGDHPSDKTASETRDQHQPLAVRKRRRVADVPREFDAAVRGVDVLTAWPGRTREPPG